jgi:hypothetical protein
MCVAGVQKARQALRQIWDESPELLEPVAAFFELDVDQRLRDDTVWQSLSTPRA